MLQSDRDRPTPLGGRIEHTHGGGSHRTREGGREEGRREGGWRYEGGGMIEGGRDDRGREGEGKRERGRMCNIIS